MSKVCGGSFLSVGPDNNVRMDVTIDVVTQKVRDVWCDESKWLLFYKSPNANQGDTFTSESCGFKFGTTAFVRGVGGTASAVVEAV